MASVTSDLIVRLSLDTTQFEGSLSKFEGQILNVVLRDRTVVPDDLLCQVIGGVMLLQQSATFILLVRQDRLDGALVPPIFSLRGFDYLPPLTAPTHYPCSSIIVPGITPDPSPLKPPLSGRCRKTV